jgi:hypothetical protein
MYDSKRPRSCLKNIKNEKEKPMSKKRNKNKRKKELKKRKIPDLNVINVDFSKDQTPVEFDPIILPPHCMVLIEEGADCIALIRKNDIINLAFPPELIKNKCGKSFVQFNNFTYNALFNFFAVHKDFCDENNLECEYRLIFGYLDSDDNLFYPKFESLGTRSNGEPAIVDAEP